MNEELKKMLDSINAKKQEVKDLCKAGKIEDAATAKEELKKLQAQFDLVYDLDVTKTEGMGEKAAAGAAKTIADKAKNIAGAFVNAIKAAVGKGELSTEDKEILNSMVNVVKIYDENKKQVGEVKNGNWIDKYGIYQQIYTKEKGINAETAAKNMLSGVEKKVTLDGINGDLSCIAGNGVEVYDKATGLNGVFWIDSDTHTWENGTHIMSLELNFKNIMDSKEYDETEE